MRQLLIPAASAAVAAVAVTSATGSAEDAPTATTTKTTRYVLENVLRQPHRDIIRRDGKRVGYFVSSRALVPRTKSDDGPWMGMHAALLPRGEIFIAGAARNAFDDEPTEAIVGGTGAYRRATGEAVVNYAGTINRLVIRVRTP
jgi:hypothetical protein